VKTRFLTVCSFKLGLNSCRYTWEMRVLLARCAAKMMNRVVSGAFNRWLEMTEEAKEMRLKVGLSVQVEPGGRNFFPAVPQLFPQLFPGGRNFFVCAAYPSRLKAPGFNPCVYEVKSRFQSLLSNPICTATSRSTVRCAR
jgi:hypothetical protein